MRCSFTKLRGPVKVLRGAEQGEGLETRKS